MERRPANLAEVSSRTVGRADEAGISTALSGITRSVARQRPRFLSASRGVRCRDCGGGAEAFRRYALLARRFRGDAQPRACVGATAQRPFLVRNLAFLEKFYRESA